MGSELKCGVEEGLVLGVFSEFRTIVHTRGYLSLLGLLVGSQGVSPKINTELWVSLDTVGTAPTVYRRSLGQ